MATSPSILPVVSSRVRAIVAIRIAFTRYRTVQPWKVESDGDSHLARTLFSFSLIVYSDCLPLPSLPLLMPISSDVGLPIPPGKGGRRSGFAEGAILREMEDGTSGMDFGWPTTRLDPNSRPPSTSRPSSERPPNRPTHKVWPTTGRRILGRHRPWRQDGGHQGAANGLSRTSRRPILVCDRRPSHGWFWEDRCCPSEGGRAHQTTACIAVVWPTFVQVWSKEEASSEVCTHALQSRSGKLSRPREERGEQDCLLVEIWTEGRGTAGAARIHLALVQNGFVREQSGRVPFPGFFPVLSLAAWQTPPCSRTNRFCTRAEWGCCSLL